MVRMLCRGAYWWVGGHVCDLWSESLGLEKMLVFGRICVLWAVSVGSTCARERLCVTWGQSEELCVTGGADLHPLVRLLATGRIYVPLGEAG